MADPSHTTVRRSTALGLWFGLLAGFLELGLVLALRAAHEAVSLESLRTNVHFVWMIPLADAALFGSCGVLLGALGRRWPRPAARLSCPLFAGLLALALLSRVEGLHAPARLVLSLGIAVSSGPMLDRRGPGLSRVVRASLPALGASLILLAAAGVTVVATAERRALSRLPAAAPGAPNVLLLVMDNVRAASTSLHGHTRPTTPNLERYALGGVRFDCARATASWTLPSHASMFTGRWHHELSVGWDRPLDGTHPTLAEYLAGRGYRTAGFVGNVYYANHRYGLGRGFARYDDYYENRTVSLFEVVRSSGLGRLLMPLVGLGVKVGYGEVYRRKTAAMLNRDALGWIAARPAGRPFFVFLNYYDAHSPCVLPEGAEARFGHCLRPHDEMIEALKRYQRRDHVSRRSGDGSADRVEREAMEIFRDSYESCIAYLDAQAGRLLAELERRGLLENTLVIVTSDHGEHFQEHGFRGHGQSVYRREVEVPLLILPPSRGRVAGRAVVPDPVTLRDLPATVVDLLSLEGPSPFPGRSLTRYWQAGQAGDGPNVERAPVLSEVEHMAHVPLVAEIPATKGDVKALVAEGQVYIRNGQGDEELYNLKHDPLERCNLAASPDHGRSLERLRSMLDQIVGRRPAGETPAPGGAKARMASADGDEAR